MKHLGLIDNNLLENSKIYRRILVDIQAFTRLSQIYCATLFVYELLTKTYHALSLSGSQTLGESIYISVRNKQVMSGLMLTPSCVSTFSDSAGRMDFSVILATLTYS